MDYSDRVNSKQGAGGIADQEDVNVHRKKRVKELLTSSILNLENDPYVFRNHLGLLECKLCLTTHNNESSYLAHIGGKKHQLNLQKRKLLDDKKQKAVLDSNVVSISNTPKRKWDKIGKPQFKMTKIRDDKTFQLGILVNVKYPHALTEPVFRILNYYELTSKNQNVSISYHDKYGKELDVPLYNNKEDSESSQYLVISCEPYENICLVIPGDAIDKTDEISDSYWWYWDKDIKEFYLQFLYKN